MVRASSSWLSPKMPVLLLLAMALVAPARLAAAAPKQAPFGDKVSAAFFNYNRASPYIGSAGTLGKGGLAEAKRLGFKIIIDLRTAKQGATAEAAEAKAVGIRYVNIPVSTRAPTDKQVAAFAALVGDRSNYPILMHCETANRTGAMWALYRAYTGVPANIAVQEGRTLGLKPSREKAVRVRLGLPPLVQ